MNTWIQQGTEAKDWTRLIRADEVVSVDVTRGTRRYENVTATEYDLPEDLRYVQVQDRSGTKYHLTSGVPVQRAAQMARELTAAIAKAVASGRPQLIRCEELRDPSGSSNRERWVFWWVVEDPRRQDAPDTAFSPEPEAAATPSRRRWKRRNAEASGRA